MFKIYLRVPKRTNEADETKSKVVIIINPVKVLRHELLKKSTKVRVFILIKPYVVYLK